MKSADNKALMCVWFGAMICCISAFAFQEYPGTIISGILSFTGGVTLSLLAGLILLYSRGRVTVIKASVAIGLWIPLSLAFAFFYALGYQRQRNSEFLSSLDPMLPWVLGASIIVYVLLLSQILRMLLTGPVNDPQKWGITMGVTAIGLIIFHLLAILALFISFHLFIALFVSIVAMCITANSVRKQGGESPISYIAKNRVTNVILFVFLTLIVALISMLIPTIPVVWSILEENKYGNPILPLLLTALAPVLYAAFAQEYFISRIHRSSPAHLILPALLILIAPVIANVYAMIGDQGEYYGTSAGADYVLEGYTYFAYPVSLIGILWALGMAFPSGHWRRLLLLLPLPFGWFIPGMLVTLMPGISVFAAFVVMAPALFRWNPKPTGEGQPASIGAQ
ncbi:MAG: hypothetical protein Q4C87_07635 [Actinomycetaceae bacterium]|nr:hypothetical protein [Actinomycetaceae bacterium]